MPGNVKVWIKFTGRHKDVHRYCFANAAEALACQAGADGGIPMQDLPHFVDLCMEAVMEWDGHVPYVAIFDAMAEEYSSQEAGNTPNFELEDPKAAVSYIASIL